jgi:hypothetical protein
MRNEKPGSRRRPTSKGATTTGSGGRTTLAAVEAASDLAGSPQAVMPLHLTVTVHMDAVGSDDEVEQHAVDVAASEALQFIARLGDRLQDEGHDDVRLRVT